MRHEGEIDGVAKFSYSLNPSLESVVGKVVSGCVGFDSVRLLTKKITQKFFALLNGKFLMIPKKAIFMSMLVASSLFLNLD